MSLTGRTKTKAPPAPQKIKLEDLLTQLDHEWETLKQDDAQKYGLDEAGLLAYYHCCLRPALYWIEGDPYTYTFPDAYQHERLAKLCQYLRGLQHETDKTTLKKARELSLRNLRKSWPPFRDLAYPDMPADWPGSTSDWETPLFNWEVVGVPTWDGVELPEKARALELPAFRYPESANFHLNALAVLFLNRQVRYYLTDLKPHAIDDYGNYA